METIVISLIIVIILFTTGVLKALKNFTESASDTAEKKFKQYQREFDLETELKIGKLATKLEDTSKRRMSVENYDALKKKLDKELRAELEAELNN